MKWTEEDFDEIENGQLSMTGRAATEWSYGDLNNAFSAATLDYDETFVTGCNAHHSLEPRTAMSYWQNGKCYVYGSTQSQSFIIPGLAKLIGIEPKVFVYIA